MRRGDGFLDKAKDAAQMDGVGGPRDTAANSHTIATGGEIVSNVDPDDPGAPPELSARRRQEGERWEQENGSRR